MEETSDGSKSSSDSKPESQVDIEMRPTNPFHTHQQINSAALLSAGAILSSPQSVAETSLPTCPSPNPSPSTGSEVNLSRGRHWLVCLDDSKFARWCIDQTLHLMDPVRDHLHLIHVMAPVLDMAIVVAAPVPAAALPYLHENEVAQKSRCVGMLRRWEAVCKHKGIAHPTIILGRSSDAGSNITAYLEKIPIDVCVVGRRGMGALKRLFLGSTSTYILNNAQCNVLVVKSSDECEAPEKNMDAAKTHPGEHINVAQHQA